MKKFVAILTALILLLPATAFATTYTDPQNTLSFDYDDALFDISEDSVGENDDHLVILAAKDEAWEGAYIRFYIYMQPEGESVPTAESIAETIPDVEVTQGEWNGFNEVVMYDNGDESLFLVPLTTGELLTVGVGGSDIEDENTAMDRDDAISAVLDTLAIIPVTE